MALDLATRQEPPTRIDGGIREAPDPSRRRLAIVVAVGFGALLAVALTQHDLWRDELQAWAIARHSPTPWALLQNLRYEGHPPLWHLILWGPAQITGSTAPLQAVQWGLATTTAYLVVRHAPFAPWVSVLVVFGYFPLFEYGVLSRGYTLGLLLVVVALLVARHRPRRWTLLGGVLALLASTSLFGVVLAVSFAVALASDRRSDDRWRAGDRSSRLGALVLASGCLLAGVSMQPPADGLYSSWRVGYDGTAARAMAAVPWHAVIPVPRAGAHWWNSNLLDPHPTAGALMGALVFVIVALALRGSRPALALWLVAVSSTVGIAYLRDLPIEMRHEGTVYVALLAAAWLALDGGPARSRAVGALVGIVVLIQAIVGVSVLAVATSRDFTAAAATADWIAAAGPGKPVLVGDNAAILSSVAYRLDTRIVIPEHPAGQDYVQWRRAYQPRAGVVGGEQRAALGLARRLRDRGTAPLLLVTTRPLPPGSGARLLRSFQPGIVPDERYWIYEP